MKGTGSHTGKSWLLRVTATLAVLALSLTACGGGGTPRAASRSAKSPEATSGSAQFATFTSRMYPYSISYPATWHVKPATHPIGAEQFPFYDSEVVDRFGQSENVIVEEQQILISAAKVAPWTSLSDWTDKAIKLSLNVPHCARPDSIKSIELAGEPAALMTLCRGSTFFDIWAVAVHEGFGYYVLWIGPLRDEKAERGRFNQILETFAFTS